MLADSFRGKLRQPLLSIEPLVGSACSFHFKQWLRSHCSPLKTTRQSLRCIYLHRIQIASDRNLMSYLHVMIGRVTRCESNLANRASRVSPEFRIGHVYDTSAQQMLNRAIHAAVAIMTATYSFPRSGLVPSWSDSLIWLNAWSSDRRLNDLHLAG